MRRDGFISSVGGLLGLLQRWMHAATPGSITGRFDKPQRRRWLDEEAEFVAETGPASTDLDLLGLPVKNVASTEKFARSSCLRNMQSLFFPS